MQRFALIAIALVALAVPANARAALSFLVDRPSASPNDRVTVRTGATPKSFELTQRVRPFRRAVRLYLVRTDLAGAVHSRTDRRLHFVGSLMPDKNGRGLMTFSVPPLDSGTYTLAYWCPGCRPTVQRSRALLRISTKQSCPVTLPNGSRPTGQPRSVSWYGNGLLWAGLTSDGVHEVPQDHVDADGSIGNKLLWVTTPPWSAPTISGERLDASAPPLKVLGVNQGSFSGAEKPSFMSAVNFPTAGCWRLTARVANVSLSYVVDVIVQTSSTPLTPSRASFVRGSTGNTQTAYYGKTRGAELLPNDLTHELEELKLSLIRMRPDELEAAQSELLRQEISAIRLQLKRLELERIAIAEDIRRVNESYESNSAEPA